LRERERLRLRSRLRVRNLQFAVCSLQVIGAALSLSKGRRRVKIDAKGFAVCNLQDIGAGLSLSKGRGQGESFRLRLRDLQFAICRALVLA
jgi:hypothetical protein